MSDRRAKVERAALDYYQGLARERGAQYALDTAIDDIVKLRAALAEAPAPAEAEDALLKALAHAARGEGVRCWRDVEGTLPARRDGDKVARVDTAPPATGKPWCRLCCGPHIGRDHVSTPYADEPPATGEAGARGEPFGGYERERAAFDEWWADKSDEYKRAAAKGASLYGVAFDAYYARAISALPEAREGGG